MKRIHFFALLAVLAAPVAAHHGWSTFDTRHAYFVAGTVASVRWGNPHSEVVLRLDAAALPADWARRPLPAGASEAEGRATMASARAYSGNRQQLELVLAGPEWMKRWGLERRLEVGERIEAVGFLDAREGSALRPVMFWLANGQAVWQQLTAFPQRPEPVRPR
jgi:hypothetical protein